MSNPLVSVIIPVYNAENFIEQTIQSVLNQTMDFEIIVLNDGSKDNSGAVIQASGKRRTIESFTFQNLIAAFQIQEIWELKMQKGSILLF